MLHLQRFIHRDVEKAVHVLRLLSTLCIERLMEDEHHKINDISDMYQADDGSAGTKIGREAEFLDVF